MLSIVAPSTEKDFGLGFQARSLLKALRPHQWPPKQVFLFVCLPIIILYQGIFKGVQLLPGLFALVVIFCAISGAAYLINDVRDRHADILHPKKKNRPIAAGHVSVETAVIAAIVLVTCAVLVSFYMGSVKLAGIVLAYIAISQMYNAGLKHIPRLDVVLVGTLYSIRAAAGFIMVDTYPPGWYFWVILAGLVACNIAFVKRSSELRTLGSSSQTRPSLAFYNPPERLDRDFTFSAVMTSAFFVPAAYSLHPAFTVASILVIFSHYRIWNLVKKVTEDIHPIDLVRQDPPLVGAVVSLMVFFGVVANFFY